MSNESDFFLTASYLIRPDDGHWAELDRMAWLAKNIYNCTNYLIRQAFFADQKNSSASAPTWHRFLSFKYLKELVRKTYPQDYSALPKRVSETCIMAVISTWTGYREAHADWQMNPQKYKGEPRIPKYKKRAEQGRAECLWNDEAVHKLAYQKRGTISLSGCRVEVEIGAHLYERIRELEGLADDKPINILERIAVVKCQPRADHYQITVTYRVYPKERPTLNPQLVAGIDLGINNLMAITSNKAGFQPILVNGRPLKSLNQFFNKQKAQFQSQLPQGQYSSERLRKLHQTRARRMKDYLHCASKMLIERLLKEGIGVLIIGKNVGWKQAIQLGKVNNQNFLHIPHAQLIDMLTYKARLYGIQVLCIEESYTSKCSFLDGEALQKQKDYAGERLQRGLFRTAKGRLINADVNASYNIIRKAVPNAFADGIEDCAVNPVLVLPA